MKTSKPFSSFEFKELGEILFEKTGYGLSKYLIEQAFTRSSYSGQHGGENNENLEYLGDTILGYHVVHQLFEHYGTIHSGEDGMYYSFRAHEKDLTLLKSKIVSNHTLAEIIDKWDICHFLIVGQSDIDNEIDKQEKTKADLLEAIIGAYAVQANWDDKIMREIISKVLPIDQCISEYEKAQYRPPMFNAENAVSTLKELSEHGDCSVPIYDFMGPELLRYTEDGKPRWFCRCVVSDHGILKGVHAHSKKDAKRFAAYLVLCDMFEIPNEYGPNKRISNWGYDGEKLIVNPPYGF